MAQSFLDDCTVGLTLCVESHKARRPVPGPPSWLMVIMQDAPWWELWIGMTHFTGAGPGGLPGARSGPDIKCLLPVFRARCRYLDAANYCQGTHRVFRFPGMGEVPPHL